MDTPRSATVPHDPLVCGIDEAGRGPMAGPVCAAAVILPRDFDFNLLDDSKKMSERRRDEAMLAIYARAVAWFVAWASSEEIDRLNILRASLLAMSRAYAGVASKLALLAGSGAHAAVPPIEVIVDGLYKPDVGDVPCRAEPRADGTYPAVMAASILAKTARDRMMVRYGWLYPEYGYERHKGYPTEAHRAALREHGPSPIQRESFRLKGEGQGELPFR